MLQCKSRRFCGLGSGACGIAKMQLLRTWRWSMLRCKIQLLQDWLRSHKSANDSLWMHETGEATAKKRTPARLGIATQSRTWIEQVRSQGMAALLPLTLLR